MQNILGGLFGICFALFVAGILITSVWGEKWELKKVVVWSEVKVGLRKSTVTPCPAHRFEAMTTLSGYAAIGFLLLLAVAVFIPK